MVIGSESDRSGAPGRATTLASSVSGAGAPDEMEPRPLKAAQDNFTIDYVCHALRLNNNQRARTARYLCISREGLWKIINRFGIDMDSRQISKKDTPPQPPKGHE